MKTNKAKPLMGQALSPLMAAVVAVEVLNQAGAIRQLDNGHTIQNNYNAARSGNIYVVFNPGWFINDLDGLSVAVVHGSPWRYDTYVPILFVGNGIKPQTVSRRVHTADVAITLATAIGTRPPSGAAGEVLLEVVGQ